MWVEIEDVNYTMNYSVGDIYYYDGLDTNLAAGLYNYTVYANDTSGNENVTSQFSFTHA